jgi:hypothetical protein
MSIKSIISIIYDNTIIIKTDWYESEIIHKKGIKMLLHENYNPLALFPITIPDQFQL